ncbi:50S ribosomal protein L6 [bacterium M21]|nr:50S ribosomal protein L6 [bacterium M21]
MSRIGNQPIALKSGITVAIDGRHVTVKGAKASLEMDLPPQVNVTTEDNQVVVTRENETRQAKSNHGLTRSLINNMVIGVDAGYKKELEIRGVGYRAEVKGKVLALSLGFSHPVNFPIPEGITIDAEPKKPIITITGVDKQLVGQVAADIRAYRKPDVYKGKGIRYVGEYVIQKEGKSV